jgi:hypothetical protein
MSTAEEYGARAAESLALPKAPPTNAIARITAAPIRCGAS